MKTAEISATLVGMSVLLVVVGIGFVLASNTFGVIVMAAGVVLGIAGVLTKRRQ